MRRLSPALVAACVGLLLAGPGRAQDEKVTLDLKDATLGDAVSALMQMTNLDFVLFEGQDLRVNISVEDRPVEQVLNLLLKGHPELEWIQEHGVYIIRRKEAGGAAGAGGMTRPGPPSPRTTAPPPLPGRPSMPTRPGTTTTATGTTTGGTAGSPTVSAKRYQLIQLKYAYAPGMAALWDGGMPLMYIQIDPWAQLTTSGGGGGGFGGGGGGGRGGGFGGGGGGFGGGGGGFGGGGGGFGGGGFGGGGGLGGGGGGLGGGGFGF